MNYSATNGESNSVANFESPGAADDPMIAAAIDLGTNNCRLLIAKKQTNGFIVLDAFSRVVQLGKGIERGNQLSEEAIDRTLEALKACAIKIANHQPQKIRAVATEACRLAGNIDYFINRVQRETKIEINVISSLEEALLVVSSCVSLIESDYPYSLIFDIGGGSTELVWLEQQPDRVPRVLGMISLPYGVMRLPKLQSVFVSPSRMDGEGYKAISRYLQQKISDFDRQHGISEKVRKNRVQLIGNSGTATTLASLHLGLNSYKRALVDSSKLPRAEIMQLSQQLLSMTPQQRLANPIIGQSRGDFALGGCAILDGIMTLWPVDRITVADRGVREGILLRLLGLAPKLAIDAELQSSKFKPTFFRGKPTVGQGISI